jgi:hypothetical protein
LGTNQRLKIPDAEQIWPHQPTEALLPVSIRGASNIYNLVNLAVENDRQKITNMLQSAMTG